MKKLLSILILSAFLLSGCAGVKLYHDESFTKRTGLKFYYPKPYLLVERNGAKDVPLKTTLIFLPDLTDPVYAKVTKGLGSNAFSIALTNGALSAYGVTTDSKIPETITAAGGLLTGAGGLLGGIAALKPKADVKQAASVKDLQEAKLLIDGVKKDIVDENIVFPDFLTSNQKTSYESAKAEITNSQKLVNALDPTIVKEIIKSLDKVIENLGNVECKQETNDCKNFNGKFIALISQLEKAKEILQPKDNDSASFELYEIMANGKEITYKLVKQFIAQ
jgi:hypothetical protein